MSKIQFKVVKQASVKMFEEDVEKLLNEGFHVEKFDSAERGSWTYFMAYMIKGI